MPLYGKTIENRTWAPPEWLIGQPLAIHSGKVTDPAGVQYLRDLGFDPFPDLRVDGYPKHWQRNGVVALAVVAGYLAEHHAGAVTRRGCADSSPSAGQIDRWFVGPYGWVLSHVAKVGPYICLGRQGLWNLRPDLAQLALEDAARQDDEWAARLEAVA